MVLSASFGCLLWYELSGDRSIFNVLVVLRCNWLILKVAEDAVDFDYVRRLFVEWPLVLGLFGQVDV